MAGKRIFTTPEEVLAELQRQREEDSDSESDTFDDEVSESEDEILPNNDDLDDDFDAEQDLGSMSDTDNEREFELGRDEDTIWTMTPVRSKFAKTPACNIVTHLPGPKGNALGLTDELELFSLFITDQIINDIVLYTNQQILKSQKNYKSDQWFISTTDTLELKALLGLLFMAGVLKNCNLNPDDFFSPVFGPSLFRATMTKKRFDFLLVNLRFDDKDTRDTRKSSDKFAAFRDLWISFEKNCSDYYTPSQYLTVDETLLSFRGRCPFRMYIPKKPDKYGLKIISICDARTFYFLGGIPYIGKENLRKKSDLSLPTQYVLRLTESMTGTNRNITTDNWFSSYELAEELQKRKLSFVGTLRKNKPQIPESMLTAAPAMSSRFLYQDDKMLVSFSPKKNKKVILISTMHFTGEVDDVSKKPEIVLFYNTTKGGVDVLDKLCHDKTTKRKSRRWPLRYFFGILDIASVNSFILYKWNMNMDSFSNDARSNFMKNLAFSLVTPFSKKRVLNERLPRELRATNRSTFGIEEEPPIATTQRRTEEPSQKKRRRCDFCDKRKDRKGNEQCTVCNKCLCGEHKIVICPSCYLHSENNNNGM